VLVVAHLDGAGVEVDRHGLVTRAHVDAEPVAEGLRRAGDQPVDVVHVTGDDVGDAAGRVARPPALLQGHDLQVGAPTPGLGGGRHAARVAADHDQSLAHSLVP
jgi:hypothetical protein